MFEHYILLIAGDKREMGYFYEIFQKASICAADGEYDKLYSHFYAALLPAKYADIISCSDLLASIACGVCLYQFLSSAEHSARPADSAAGGRL